MCKRKASHPPLSRGEQGHRETVATPVSDEPQPPRGEGAAGWASRAACGGAAGRRADVPVWASSLLYVLISFWQSSVTRKERSPRVRAKPTGWWGIKLPVLPVPPPPAKKKIRRLAKREGKCLDCGETETPQWRAGPDGLRTLCNSCGVRRRAAGERHGELRGPRQPRAATDSDPDYELPSTPPPQATIEAAPPTMKSAPPAPADNSDPDYELPSILPPPPMIQAAPPTVESAPPAPALDQGRKTTKKKKKPVKPKEKKPVKPKEKKPCVCDHCGSSSTPQWREGPKGPRTLCNACGVRYRTGRLLPEYRPQASPSFDKSKHASWHSEVLELRRRQRKNKGHQEPMDPSQDVDLMPPPPPPPLPRPVGHIASELHLSAVDDNSARGDVSDVAMDDLGYSFELDPFLLDGPAAPMIVDYIIVD